MVKTLRFARMIVSGFRSIAKFALCFVVLSAIYAMPSYSETVYVSDVLFVPMRSGQGNEFRIINAAMKSGTPLSKISESGNGEWTQIETRKGTQGWIRSQYLSPNLPARLRLTNSLKELSQLKAKNIELTAFVKNLTAENIQLKTSLDGNSADAASLNEELARVKSISASAIKVDRQYQALLAEHQLLKTERDSLAAENEQLMNSSELNFLFYGALLVILGMIIAVLLPYLKRKKRFSDWA